jgi:hypothetical protein
MGDPKHLSEDGGELPSDVDLELWFTSPHPRCGGGRDYLFDKHLLTHPGRTAAYCPHDSEWPDYRISLSELPARPAAAHRYWVAGFLAGNLPPAPVVDDDDDPALARWTAKAAAFATQGTWPTDDEQD